MTLIVPVEEDTEFPARGKRIVTVENIPSVHYCRSRTNTDLAMSVRLAWPYRSFSDAILVGRLHSRHVPAVMGRGLDS